MMGISTEQKVEKIVEDLSGVKSHVYICENVIVGGTAANAICAVTSIPGQPLTFDSGRASKKSKN